MQRLCIPLVALVVLLGACAAPQVRPPAGAIDDADINRLYASRTWQPPGQLTIDPVKLGEEAQIPINRARAKLLGPTPDDGLNSLAAKLWLIEHAQHTVDLAYYIFARDTVGYAVIGALCNAVKRGVDVRVLVDSTGSWHLTHSELKALETCGNEAGFMRSARGETTTKRARVQVVIFNAVSKFHFNRRSHDKLLVVDGHFPDKSAVMTGGRNISLDYYGIQEDGSPDPTAFRDLEILVRDDPASAETVSVGSVSELYYDLLFLNKGNKRLRPSSDSKKLKRAQDSLAFLKSQPQIMQRWDQMSEYISAEFRDARVRLAHQLGNLTSTKVTTNVAENLRKNPNSILYLVHQLVDEAERRGVDTGTLRIVSPYLFSGKYYDQDGQVVYDGAQETLDFLRDHPNIKLEVITNSVMTSDNFFTQAIIDMEMAPRFLLTPELQKQWRSSLQKGEFNPQVVESDEWKRLTDHPQVFIYQTGKLDSVLLGKGTAHYGKLHAKFILGGNVGFVGTSNFDYRSNLYNSETGFFFQDDALSQDLLAIFEWLKATSYRWGSPEWLQMRKELMNGDSKKAGPARKQRGIYRTLHATGTEYLM